MFLKIGKPFREQKTRKNTRETKQNKNKKTKVLTSVWLKNLEKYSTFGKILQTNSEKKLQTNSEKKLQKVLRKALKNTPQKTGSQWQNQFFLLCNMHAVS